MKKSLLILFSLIFVQEILIAQVNFTESNLPIVLIYTNNEPIVDEYKITARFGVIYNGEGEINNITDPVDYYNGYVGIELRGSSSMGFPKKQYGFETRDAQGEDIDFSFFGMPEEEDWILNAPYADKSLMRNALIYQIAREMGHYASRTRFVEVVLNNEYQGVYVLLEKLKRDKNRVDISKLNPDETSGIDLTGGYIIKIDKWDGEDNDGWASNYPSFPGSEIEVLYQYDYPKPSEIAPEQKAYIQGFVKRFEDFIQTGEYNSSEEGLEKYIDLDSFADFFLVQELTKNVDGYRLSSFMYKDKDDKDSLLHAGPIWDFNFGFGNADYYDGFKTSGWELSYLITTPSILSGDQFQVPFWWRNLLASTQFQNRVRERYTSFRKNVLSTENVWGFIDSVKILLNEAQERNFEKWNILGQYIWPNYYIAGSYDGEVQNLKTWVYQRLLWMDNHMFDGPVSVENDSELPGNFYLSQNYPNPFNPVTTIQYTIPNNVIASKANRSNIDAITSSMAGNDDMKVTLKVYDILGIEIAELVNERKTAGTYKVQFDGKNIPSGVYFYKLKAGRFNKVKKMILLK